MQLYSHPDIAICFGCLDWLNMRREAKRAAVDPIRVAGADPIFVVADVDRAKVHYERLGFSTFDHDETYAFAHRGGLTIHLRRSETPGFGGPGSIYLHVDDADALASSWRLAGLEVHGPEDTDYERREGSHVDADGNRIRFGSPLRSHSAG